MSYAGSDLKAILDALTANMCADGGPPVGNVAGTQTDAQNANTSSSITWVPRDKQPPLVPPHEQPIDPTTGRPLGNAVAQRNLVVDAMIYGKDFQTAINLDSRLVVALYNLFGDNAASVFAAPAGELDGGGIKSGEAFAIVRPVVFAIPIYRERFKQAIGAAPSAPVVGAIVDPLGANPEPMS